MLENFKNLLIFLDTATPNAPPLQNASCCTPRAYVNTMAPTMATHVKRFPKAGMQRPARTPQKNVDKFLSVDRFLITYEVLRRQWASKCQEISETHVQKGNQQRPRCRQVSDVSTSFSPPDGGKSRQDSAHQQVFGGRRGLTPFCHGKVSTGFWIPAGPWCRQVLDCRRRNLSTIYREGVTLKSLYYYGVKMA